MWLKTKRYLHIIIALSTSLILCACNNSNNSSMLQGVVVDDPVVGATVTVYGKDFEILGTAITDSEGQYNTSIPYDSVYKIDINGGTINGVPFTGTMKSICDNEQTCDATPLTTLTAALVENHNLSYLQAKDEVSKIMLVDLDEDPFILEYEGRDSETDKNILSYIRENTNNGIDIDAWISEKLTSIPKPYNEIIKGTARSDVYLNDSQIQITNTDGNTLKTRTSADGEWESSENVVINNDFRVEAGSSVDFNGTLSTYVPYSEDMNLVDYPIELTILSTLIDRYMKYSMKSYEDATDAVKTYLSIPEDVSLDDDMIGAYFSSYEFISQSKENGGFDAYVDDLVLKVDSGESISIGGANNHAFLELSLGQLAFRGMLGGAGGKLVGIALNQAVIHLGPKIGYYTPEQMTNIQLGKIQDTLEEMQTELNAVETRLSNLTKELSEQIKSSIYAETANTATENIDRWFKEYEGILESNNTTQTAWFNGHNAENMKEKMSAINSGLFTSAFDTQSGLGYLVSSFETKLHTTSFGNDKNEVLYESYKTLETYFLKALGTQIKGMTLIRAKYTFDKQEGLADIYENSVLALDLQAQLDMFLRYTERLVAASANTQTIIQGSSPMLMFPSSAKDVFHDADFIASQISSEHDFGFIMHVAGDPKSIEEYLVSPQGYGWGAVDHISIDSQNIREYDAPLVDGTSYYLGWNIDRHKRWHFSKETKIAFAKLTFKNLTGSRLSPKHRVYTFPYTQKASVDFEQIEPNNTPYAHCFVTARAVPKFNFKNENMVHETKKGDIPIFVHTVDFQNASTKAIVAIEKSNTNLAIFDVDTYADMYFEVINDSNSEAKLQLSGNVNLDVDSRIKTDLWMIGSELELHLQVKVGGDNVFSREWKYDINTKSNRSSEHNKDYTDDGRAFTWQGGGTLNNMRQVYFRVSRAKTKIEASSLFSKHDFDFDTVFKTTLEKLEIKPVE